MRSVAYFLLGSALTLTQALAADLPPGKGRDTFNRVCTTCHAAEVSTDQRHSRADWARIVQTMKDYGADANPAQANEISDYLAEHFGPKAGAPSAVKAEPAPDKPVVRRKLPWEKNSLRVGQALYRENCVMCHDIDGLPGKKLGPSFQGLFKKEKMPLANAKPNRVSVGAKIRAGGTLMPSFNRKLTSGEIDALIDYMQTK